MAEPSRSWSIRDTENCVDLNIQTDGDNFALSVTEENENGHIIDFTATRDDMRELANWILVLIS